MEENLTDGGHGRALDRSEGESEQPATLMQDASNQFFSNSLVPCTMCAEMDASVAEENVTCKLSICQ